jgi:hypothetical protein
MVAGGGRTASNASLFWWPPLTGLSCYWQKAINLRGMATESPRAPQDLATPHSMRDRAIKTLRVPDLSRQDSAPADLPRNGGLLGAGPQRRCASGGECGRAYRGCRSRRGRARAAEQFWRFARDCPWIPRSGLGARSESGLRQWQDGVHDSRTRDCRTKRAHTFPSAPTVGRAARREPTPLGQGSQSKKDSWRWTPSRNRSNLRR